MRRIWEELLIYWTRAIRLPKKDIEKGEYMGEVEEADEDRQQPFYLTPIIDLDRPQTSGFSRIGPDGLRMVPADPDVGGYSFPVQREKTKDPININMMPFIAAENFEECKLPESVRPYWSLIKACLAPEMERSWHYLWDQWKVP